MSGTGYNTNSDPIAGQSLARKCHLAFGMQVRGSVALLFCAAFHPLHTTLYHIHAKRFGASIIL